MAMHDLDHQPSGPGLQPVTDPASRRRPGATAGPPAAHSSPGWMSRAACLAEDPELFFPVTAAGPALAQASMAKAVCRRCPVQPNCLSYALVTGQAYGIWGGTTAEERWPARHQRHHFPARRGGRR